MERITTKQVDGIAERVNRALKTAGSPYYVAAQGRNGGTGLDLCYRQGETEHVSRGLTFGTKREVWDYLYAMATALDLVADA